MRISVIIPLFNQADVVAEALRSALAQTLPPLEVIIVDDGSTDGGALVLDPDPRVRILRQDRRGPAAARNLAAHESKGDWLAFLDADDLWLPQKLERQAEALASSTGAALVHTDGHVINAVGAPLPPTSFFTGRTPPQGADAASALLRCPLLTPSVLVRRDAFESVGGFNESRRLHEDMELYFRLAAGGAEFVFVPEPLVVVRVLKRTRSLDDYLAASVELQEDLRKDFPGLAPQLDRRISSTWQALAALAVGRGDFGAARAAYHQSLSRRGFNRFDLFALFFLRLGLTDRVAGMNRELLEKLRGSTSTAGD